APVVNEDTALALGGTGVTDEDGNLPTRRSADLNGTVTVTLSGGATITAGANGTATLTLSGSQADINATLASLAYQGTLNYNGPDTLTVTSRDSNAVTDVDTVAITVLAVDDARSEKGRGGEEGTSALTLRGGATITAGANGTATLTLSGSQADINATLASLAYQGTLNYNGPDTLTVTSRDSNAVTDVDTVAITVLAVDDA